MLCGTSVIRRGLMLTSLYLAVSCRWFSRGIISSLLLVEQRKWFRTEWPVVQMQMLTFFRRVVSLPLVTAQRLLMKLAGVPGTGCGD